MVRDASDERATSDIRREIGVFVAAVTNLTDI
jgi:hypothetical protein